MHQDNEDKKILRLVKKMKGQNEIVNKEKQTEEGKQEDSEEESKEEI